MPVTQRLRTSSPQLQSDKPIHPIAGKWQIPAFLMSAVALIVAVVNIKSPERKIGIDEHLARMADLIDRGIFVPVVDLADSLLGWDDLDPQKRAMIELYVARATYGQARRLEPMTEAVATEILQKYETAETSGAGLSGQDQANIATCYERLRQYVAAVAAYEQAVELAPPPALAYRRRIIELSAYPLRIDPVQIDQMLQTFIEKASNNPADLMWAVSRRVETIGENEGWKPARTFLEGFREQFAGTSFEAEYQYLVALTLRGNGEYDAAERMLRDLLNRHTVSDAVYSKAGWLLGQVVMYDGRAQRPQEALAIFRDVIAARVDMPSVVASRVGMGEALAWLYRYDESLKAYREALADLAMVGERQMVNRDVIRTSLTVVAERCRREDRPATALEFMRLATSLVPDDDVETRTSYLYRLGDLLTIVARDVVRQADELSDSEEDQARRRGLLMQARKLFDEAGEAYVNLSWINTLNEERSANAMWRAANLFDEGRNHERAIEVLRAFANERPDADIVPRVLLRLGKSLQALGRYEEAIEAYQRNYAMFPRSPHANASLIPLAECFMALGGASESEAERALLEIVQDSPIFTPEAVEYRDAMFLLGDLYTRRQQWETAIPVLEEALQNYPDDPRVPKAMFLVAESYRQSAMALKNDLLQPEYIGESRRLRSEHTARLEEAAARFRALIEKLEARDESTLDKLQQVYLQDARLYEASCLFELGRYQEALTRYERVAWLYKDKPAALGAYVQVINCYIFLGRTQDARVALNRAQYLTETIPEDAFKAEEAFDSRERWKRYFDWVSEILTAK